VLVSHFYLTKACSHWCIEIKRQSKYTVCE